MKTTANRLCFFAVLMLAFVCTACSKEARRDRALQKANSDFEGGRYDRAEIGYRDVLRTPPPSPEALVNLGKIYYSQGRWQSAAEFISEGLKRGREDLGARISLGHALWALTAFQSAREQAKAVLEKQPANDEALLLLVESSFTTNDLAEARAAIARVPQSTQTTALLLAARGSLLLRERNLPGAIQECKNAIAADPKNPQAHAALATALLATTNRAEAIQSMRMASELSPPNSRMRIIYADLQRGAGDTNTAKAVLEQVTKEAPKFVPAWLLLAQMAGAQRDYRQAEEYVKKSLTIDSQNVEALLLYGDLMLVQGEATNAVTHFERVAERYEKAPVSAMARFKAAQACVLSRDNDRALENLGVALKTATNYAAAILLFSELNLSRRNPNAVRPLLESLVRNQPGILDTYLHLRTTYLQLGDTNQALNILAVARKRFPDNPQVPVSQGAILHRLSKLDQAREAFRDALTLAPDNLMVFKQAVDFELLTTNFPNAFGLITPRLQQQTNSALLNYMAGYVYQYRHAWAKNRAGAQDPQSQGDLEKAVGLYTRTIEIEPRLSDAYYALASAKDSSGAKEEALAVLQRLVNRNTNDANAYLQLAGYQAKLGKFQDARAGYEQSLRLSPTNFAALNNLAYIYSEQTPDLDKALSYAQEAYKLARTDPSVLDTLGWIRYRRGEVQQSLPLLQEALSGFRAQNRPAEEPEFHLAMALYMVGDEDAARNALRAAAAAKSDFKGKDTIPARLELLDLDPARADASVLGRLEKEYAANPKDPVVARKLALVYEQSRQNDKAKQVYDSALQLHPRNARLLAQAAELYAGPLKDESKANELAKRLRSLSPDSPAAARILGRIAFRTGDHRWARSLLDESAQRYADDPELQFDLAWAEYSLGNTNASLERAQRSLAMPGFTRTNEAKVFVSLVSAAASDKTAAEESVATARLKDDPKDVPALMVLGIAKDNARNYTEAARHYTQALNVFTNFTPAVRNLALAEFRQTNYSPQVLALLNRASTAFPSDPELLRAAGVVACERGDFGRADQALRRLVESPAFAADPEVHFYQAKAKVGLKRPTEAKPLLEKAVKSGRLPANLKSQAEEMLAKMGT